MTLPRHWCAPLPGPYLHSHYHLPKLSDRHRICPSDLDLKGMMASLTGLLLIGESSVVQGTRRPHFRVSLAPYERALLAASRPSMTVLSSKCPRSSMTSWMARRSCSLACPWTSLNVAAMERRR